MDPSNGYNSWPPHPTGNSELSWHLGPDGMPQTSASGSMQYANANSYTSSQAMSSNMSPAFSSHDQQMLNLYQQQQHYPQQSIPYPSHYSTAPQMTPTPGFTNNALTVDQPTFHALQAQYPNATTEELMGAIFPPQGSGSRPVPAQSQQQHQLQQQYYHQSQPQAPSHYDVYGTQSGHSLADALTFKTPSSAPAPASGQTQSALAVPPPPGPSTASATNASHAKGNGDATALDAKANKGSKLRQSKLMFVRSIGPPPSTAPSPALAPAPALNANAYAASGLAANVTTISDSASEPGTPPLPLAKTLAAKSTASSSKSTAAVKAGATTPKSADALLWEKAKQPLSRLSVLNVPQQSARDLIKILCELDSEGRFRKPVSTGLEVRKNIVDTLNAIASLATGRGFTDAGRKKFFGAWMASPAGRHILSSWLRQTVPPKKLTEGVADLSRRYKETLHPLLAVLDYVPIKKAYLTDEAGLGKAITGVSLRAVDPSARVLAQKLKAKWTKVIDEEDAITAPKAKPAPAAGGSAPAPTAVKRKPAEGSTTNETTAKKYKPAAATASGSAAAKPAPKTTQPSSAAPNAKPGLSFFGPGSSSVKKPTSSPGSSATSGSGSSSNKASAGQSVMNFLGTLTGGNGNDSAAAGQARREGSAAAAQSKPKVKKRVTWKDDSELVAIKLIEPADYGQDDAQHAEAMEKGLGGLEHDEGDALRKSYSTMEEQMDWHGPRELLVVLHGVETQPLGSESVEGPFQTQRNAGLEEVIYEDSKAPDCPDESQLEQPGSMSQMPKELDLEEPVEIPTPWSVDEEEDIDAMDEPPAYDEGGPSTDTPNHPNTAAPSSADIGALLSKLGSVVGGSTGAMPAAQAPSTAEASTSGPKPAPSFNFDVNALRSILDQSRGTGPSSNAVNAAMASQNISTDGLSSLLSSLSSNRAAPVGDNGNYWQSTYRPNGAEPNRMEESYPGEYQQQYGGGGGQQYHRTSQYEQVSQWAQRGGQGGNGWDTEPNQSRSGSAWQDKVHTKPCFFYNKGHCRNGTSCPFSHHM